MLATNTGTTVNEASTGNVLTSGMLQTTDVDNTNAQLVYTVTGATGNGTLRLSGTALGVSDTFTQADIDAGNVTYDHDGSETTTDSFDFSVDDGQGTASTGTFNFTVNPVNDEQVLATNMGTTVNEGSTGNVLTSGMLLTTDVDNTAAQLIYTVTSATGNGTLRLSGTALGVSDTFTQADIDAGNMTYDHDGSETTADSFDFSVDDGQGTASTGTFNFTVTPVNDEEVLATNTGTTVNEGSTSNLLTSGMLQTTDVDNTAAQLIYTVTSATSNGTLRLSGTALGVSDTFTQADIDAGNLAYDHNGSETTTDSFDFDVDDGQGTASTGTFNFTVNPVNDEEVLATNTGTTVNEASTGNVLTSGMLQTTDVDNTNAQLVYTVTGATGNGTLRLSGTALGVSDTFTQADIDAGNLTYDHDGSETTTDSFDFSVDDGQGAASAGTFNFTVNPVNDEEVLVTNAGTTVNEGSASNVLTSGMLQTTDVDNTSGQLVYTVTSATSNGTLRLSGTALGVTDTFTQADIDAGNVTYDHDGSETTTDSFDFSVDDGQGTASTGTFNFTVNPVNDEQVLAVNAGTTVNEASTGNVLTSGMLLTTDVDNTSGQLVYTVTAATGNGTLRLSGTALGVSDTFTQADIDAGNLTYDHNGSETTTDSFDFSVDDGQGTASTGTFNFTVNPVNDEEVLATNTGTTVNEASTGNVLTSGMLQTTDVDNTNAQLVYTVTGATGNGTLRLSGTALGVSDTFTQADIDAGNLTYDHDGSETTTDSFDFSVDDGQGTASTGTFNFTVTPVNDEEVLATNMGTTVNEGSTNNVLTSGMLQTTDVDNTAAQLIYTVTSATGNGTLRLSGTALGVSDTFTQADIDAGNMTYDHDGSETTADSFDFSVDDGQGTASTGTFNLTVTPVNDSPTVATNTGMTATEASSGNVLTTAMLNEGDPDDAGAGLTYTIATATVNGTLRLSGTALGVSDTFTQADIDAGNVTYDHDGSETTTDGFDFLLSDGGEDGATPAAGTFNITITGSNDEQVLAVNTGAAINEGTAGNPITTLMLQTTDVDNTPAQLAYTVTSATGNGTLRLSGTALGVSDTFTQADIDAGNVTYDHDGSETTTDSFDFSVDDGQGTASTGTFNFTVNPVNDEQVLAINTGTTVNEGSTGNVLTSGMLQTTDVDNTAAQLVYTVTSAIGNGTLRLSGTVLGVSDTFTQADINAGNVTYNHDGSETTTDSFDFDVDDGAGTNNSGTFNITVTPVNDEQVLATNTGTTVDEGSSGNLLTSGMLQTTDVDNTSGQLVYTVTSTTANGTLRLSGMALGVSDTFTQADIDAGNVAYDHHGGETTTDAFDFSVDDGQGTASTGTFNLTVTPVNDSPTIATNTGMTAAEASTGNVLTTAMLNEGDPDDAGAGLTYTITTATLNGTLRLLGTALGVSDTFTQADIDAGNVTYDHDGSETTGDRFGFSLIDGGNDGAIPFTGTFNFTITPTNDAPTIVSSMLSINEGQTLTLTTGDIGAADPEGDALTYLVTGVTGGQFELVSSPGAAVTTFSSVQLVGGQVQFVHDGGESAPTFTVEASDGSLTSGPRIGTVNFTNLNDDPFNSGSLPVSVTVAEDLRSDVDLSTINIQDVDAGSGVLTLTLTTSTGGQLFANSGVGVTVTGNATGTISLTGAESALNSFVDDPANVQYQHITVDINGTGVDTITVSVRDYGNTGLGGGGPVLLGDVIVDVAAVNDAPTNITGGPVATNEETSTVFSSGNGNAIQVGDRDAGNGAIRVQLSVDDGGVITLSRTSGLTFLTGDGSADARMDFAGTIADINAALEGMTFTPTVDFHGTANLTVATDDQGNHGLGGPMTDVDVIPITVAPTNDAPTAGDDSFTTIRNGTLDLPSTVLLANDVDVDGDTLNVAIRTMPAAGLLVPLANGSFQYIPLPGFVGTDSFTYWAFDSSGTGDIGTVTIDVTIPLLIRPTGGGRETGHSPPTHAGDSEQDDQSAATTVIIIASPFAEESENPVIVRRISTDASIPSTDDLDLLSISTDYHEVNLVGDRVDIANLEALNFASTRSAPAFAASPAVLEDAYLEQLNQLAGQFEGQGEFDALSAIALGSAASAATVAYILWTIRSGYMFAGMVASLPVWMRVDPLPVLDFNEARKRSARKSSGPSGSLFEALLHESPSLSGA